MSVVSSRKHVLRERRVVCGECVIDVNVDHEKSKWSVK